MWTGKPSFSAVSASAIVEIVERAHFSPHQQGKGARLILYSMQYIDALRNMLGYVVVEGFDFHVQWLNPVWEDERHLPDSLGLMPWLLHQGATVAIRDGQAAPGPEVEENRETVQGRAIARGLTISCPARIK